MDALNLRLAKASEAGVSNLIAHHFALMRANSPEESCHVLDSSALDSDDTSILVVEENGETLGVGALKVIGPDHGELKSMHTAQAHRGRGIARKILNGLIDRAREQGVSRLSLETGSAEMFEPARALYAAEGFVICPPFGTYTEDPLSVFMTRDV